MNQNPKGQQKTRAELGREIAELRNAFITTMQKIQEDFQMYNYIIKKILDETPKSQFDELSFTEEELFANYEPLIFDYVVEKKTGNIAKMIPAVAGWKVESAEPREEDKVVVFKFTHAEKGERLIEANNMLEAWSKLRELMRTNIIAPKIEIVSS
jgi:hypothetical protein